jgi:hypothetical protein
MENGVHTQLRLRIGGLDQVEPGITDPIPIKPDSSQKIQAAQFHSARLQPK